MKTNNITTRTNNIKRSILLLLFMFVLVGGFTIKAEASTLLQQTVDTAKSTLLNTAIAQGLGTGNTGYISGISFKYYLNTVQTSDRSIAVKIIECTANDYTTVTGSCTGKTAYLADNPVTVFTSYTVGTTTGTVTWATPVTMSSSKYYYIELFNSSCNDSCWSQIGSTANTYANGAIITAGFNSASPVVDMYFTVTGSTTYTAPNTTKFTSVVPVNNAVIINPNVTFTANWNITLADYAKLASIFSSGVAGKVRVTAQISDPYKSTWSCTVIDWTDNIGYITSTSTTILFNGSNSCGNLDYGRDYKITWGLTGTKYNNIFGPEFSISTTTYFSVGTTTNAGNVSGYVASSTLADQNIQYVNGYDPNSCLPVPGYLDVPQCLAFLFIPDTGYIKQKIGEQYSILTSAFPLGYITDFISILATTSESSGIGVSGTIPSVLPGGGTHFSMTITSSTMSTLYDATSSVFSTATENDTRSFYDITSYYWNIIVGILFVMYLATRLLGSTFNIDFGSIERATGGRSRILGISGKARKGSNAELGKQGLIKDKDGIIRKQTF